MQLTSHEILTLLGSLLGGGVGVSLLVQGAKKSNLVKALTHELTVLVSVLGGVAQYVAQYHSKLPASFLGVSTVGIYGFSQLVYKYSQKANSLLSSVYGGSSSSASSSSTETTASESTPTGSTETAASTSAAASEETPPAFAG